MVVCIIVIYLNKKTIHSYASSFVCVCIIESSKITNVDNHLIVLTIHVGDFRHILYSACVNVPKWLVPIKRLNTCVSFDVQ